MNRDLEMHDNFFPLDVGIHQTSKTSFQSMWAMNKDLEMHENFFPLDVGIHHRICDVSKHLLQALNKLKKSHLYISSINVTIQQKVKKRLKHHFNRCGQ